MLNKACQSWSGDSARQSVLGERIWLLLLADGVLSFRLFQTTASCRVTNKLVLAAIDGACHSVGCKCAGVVTESTRRATAV
jgi:hypothetical protein